MRRFDGSFYDSKSVSAIIKTFCEKHSVSEHIVASSVLGIHPSTLSVIKAGISCSPGILQKIAVLGTVNVNTLILTQPPDEIANSVAFNLTTLKLR